MTDIPKQGVMRSRVRMMRVQLALGFLLTMSGIIVLTLLPYDYWHLFGIDTRYPPLVGLTLVGFGISVVMVLYLKGAISFKFLDRFITLADDRDYTRLPVAPESNDASASAGAIETQSVQMTLIELSRTVDQLRSAQLDALAGSKDDLIAALRPTLLTDIAAELESKFASEAVDTARLNTIRRSFEISHQRLKNELSSLSRRSNLNLVIGIITTCIAVALLTYMVLGTHSAFDSLTQLLSHYVPRVTVVLFIEFFSFFFLRLYKSTLGEIRLYQEDITALTLRQAALETAWSSSDRTARAALARELVTSSIPSRIDLKGSKDIPVDPDIINDLLQTFAKAIVKKDKGN